jgi:NADPH2:quinone reductase
VPADRLVNLPDGVSDRTAATLMLKGLTVQYLLRQTFPLKGADDLCSHAGGGRRRPHRLARWTRALGVTMIGTVGSDEKAAIAKGQLAARTPSIPARTSSNG